MPTVLPIEAFLALGTRRLVVDVRTPSEFAQGHLPGAQNVPLFDDAGRAVVGTVYHQAGRYPAVLKGLELAGPRLRAIVEEVSRLQTRTGDAESAEVAVHCWRGGMRSRSVGWLLEQADYRVSLLDGGYKSFRRYVLASFLRPRRIVALSGLTGAGKTHQIQALAERGEQTIDLEALARHRGSAFGGIGLEPQPTVEQFENELSRLLDRCDPRRRLWIEDESQRIGRVVLPGPFFAQLKQAPAIFLEVSPEQRRRAIEQLYGAMPLADLAAAIRSISKRLGGLQTTQALAALDGEALGPCIEILLDYYDRTYYVAKAKISRPVFHHLPVDQPLSPETTTAIIDTAERLGL